MEITRRRFLRGLAGIVAGAVIVGTSLIEGCTENDAQRIRNSYKGSDSSLKGQIEGAVNFYNSINVNNLTREQKAMVESYNRNPDAYKRAISVTPWITGKLTTKDKIYIATLDEAAGSAAGMMAP